MSNQPQPGPHGRPSRAATQRILATRVLVIGLNTWRHVHTLECGHEAIRAPRSAKKIQKRIVCEECGL